MNNISLAPGSLMDLLTSPATLPIIAEGGGLPSKGARNNYLISLAGSLRRKDVPFAGIHSALMAANALFDDPLDDNEVRATAQSIMRYSPAVAVTEQDQAARFAESIEDKFRYHPALGWLVFDGTRWLVDEGDLYVQEAAKLQMNHLQAQAETLGSLSPEEQKALAKAVKLTRKRSFVTNIAALAKSDSRIHDSGTWDDRAGLINFENGTLDVRARTLREHDPSDRLMKVLPFRFDPKATCPIFDRVLNFALDKATANFLLELLGCALAGKGSDLQKFVLLIGNGRNGKTTILEAIAHTLGSYSTTTDPRTFTKSQTKSAINNDIAALRGARLIKTSELNPGEQLDGALVKRITGGEEIAARFLHKEFITFKLKGLPVMASNVAPVFDGSDYAMARRLIVVPFNNVVSENEVDPTLPQKLEAEAPGIVNRLLEGLYRYEDHGLTIPEAVAKATSLLINDRNVVSQFIEECCILGNVESGIGASDLYSRYCTWSYAIGANPMGQMAFKNTFTRLTGIEQTRSGKGRSWKGVQFAS